MGMPQRILKYKVVETSAVHDQALEDILNTWVPQGWRLESIQFAMSSTSKRPSMAFILFTQDVLEDPESDGQEG